MLRRLRWKATLCGVIAYLIVAGFAGLFIYQWVPIEYTLAHYQNWSWPPSSDSLGMLHGKRLASAAGREDISPEGASATRQWVRDEQTTFFQKWVRPAFVGIILTISVMLASNLLRRPRPSGKTAKAG